MHRREHERILVQFLVTSMLMSPLLHALHAVYEGIADPMIDWSAWVPAQAMARQEIEHG